MAESGRLRGGRALTGGLGALAQRGLGGEGTGALLWAQEGCDGEGHTEEQAARAAGHRQCWPQAAMSGSGARNLRVDSPAAGLAHVRRSDAPLLAGPSPGAEPALGLRPRLAARRGQPRPFPRKVRRAFCPEALVLHSSSFQLHGMELPGGCIWLWRAKSDFTGTKESFRRLLKQCLP